MQKRLIKRLETLETYQFGSPRVAQCIRELMESGDLEYFKKLAELLSNHELDCVITFLDRAGGETTLEGIDQELRQTEEAQQNADPQERYSLNETRRELEMRRWTLRGFLLSKRPLLAVPLHRPTSQKSSKPLAAIALD